MLWGCLSTNHWVWSPFPPVHTAECPCTVACCHQCVSEYKTIWIKEKSCIQIFWGGVSQCCSRSQQDVTSHYMGSSLYQLSKISQKSNKSLVLFFQGSILHLSVLNVIFLFIILSFKLTKHFGPFFGSILVSDCFNHWC